MDTMSRDPRSAAIGKPDVIGRISAVNGSQSVVDLIASALGEKPTVGKFMGLISAKALIIGLITEVAEQPTSGAVGGQTFKKVARLDLIGELRADARGVQIFQRGVTEYPNIGDSACMLTESDLRLV